MVRCVLKGFLSVGVLLFFGMFLLSSCVVHALVVAPLQLVLPPLVACSYADSKMLQITTVLLHCPLP